jgi:type IV pilus assembly protein PilM
MALLKNNSYFCSESCLSAASLVSEKSKSYFFAEPNCHNLLGLAIGSSSVKLLELRQINNRQYCIERYAITPVVQSIPHAIEQAIALSGTQLSCAAIAMPDSEVISKIIQMDATLSPDEMEETIMADTDKHFHYPAHEVCFDFEILGPTPKNPQFVDVLLIASRSEQVDARIKLVNAAGLTVEIVDVQSHALERATNFMMIQAPSYHQEKAILIADIGYSIINIMVLYKNKIIFSRSESFDNTQLPHVYIQRAVHFFFASPQQKEITHMLLMGGGSYAENLCSQLQTNIGISASISNPFATMSVSPHINAVNLKNDARLMITCCGLALRSFDS